MSVHSFLLKAHWEGGLNGVGVLDTGNLKTKISVPREMDGPGIGTNPDEMLLGAAATCYMITLAAMLEHAHISVSELSMESEGMVEVKKGVLSYKTIIYRPTVILVNHDQIELAQKLADKAEKNCMISRALKGNVQIMLQANIY